MKVIEVTQPGVDGEARWTKKAGKALFGYYFSGYLGDLCPFKPVFLK